MPDPRRATPRTDHVLADPRLRGRRDPARAGPGQAGRHRARWSGAAAGELDPAAVADAAVAALPASATTLRAGSSTPPGSWSTPTSAARPCPRAAVEAAAHGGRRHRRRARPRDRAARTPGPRRAGGAGRRRARRRRGPRRQQRRGRPRPRHAGAGARRRRARHRGHRPRRAGRDRRRLPDPRADGVGRRPAARGRHDEPGAPRRLRRGGRRLDRVRPQGPPLQLRRHAASPPRCRPRELAGLDRGAGSRSWSTSAPGCSRRTRGCPTSPTPAAPSATAPTWSPPPATSCSVARSAGLLLGEAALVERLRRDPFARALRVDKLTLAALEATLAGPVPPVRGRARVGRSTTSAPRAARDRRGVARRPGRGPRGRGRRHRGRGRRRRRTRRGAPQRGRRAARAPRRTAARGRLRRSRAALVRGRLLLDLLAVDPVRGRRDRRRRTPRGCAVAGRA